VQLFDRPNKGERAVLVHVIAAQGVDAGESVEEFTELVVSAGADPVVTVEAKRRAPDPALFIGKGKLQEVITAVQQGEAEVVIFSHALSPAQERNLERELKCRVLDRTGLILDIFAQRARSFEGKLQVELAQLRHLSTRLVRGWTHLERQRGGIGLRGPGETQLETDRRLIGERIKQLKKRLEKVLRQRHEQRKTRTRSARMTVSVVGYTNAGKSTLFNHLTGAQVYAADQLFATLDPTLRRVALSGAEPVILADTVGFIRDLPHNLVAAFRATLEETVEADLLLHVVDSHDEARDERIQQVNSVLQEIGAEQIPQLLIYNKIDLLPDVSPRVDRDEQNRALRVWVSAATGQGLDLLRQVLAEFSREHARAQHQEPQQRDVLTEAPTTVHFDVSLGRVRALLYARDLVSHEELAEDGGWILQLPALPPDVARLVRECIERGEAEALSPLDVGGVAL
jgi:GTP-binding protein HflX